MDGAVGREHGVGPPRVPVGLCGERTATVRLRVRLRLSIRVRVRCRVGAISGLG